ncbi:MAG: DUF2442 domain-containing protein [Cellvibrionales bacterium]|nr:DUF2442 domain-containing protein [Cellvibrionales bacterium]
MITLAVDLQPQAQTISFTQDSFVVDLVDGRTIRVPLHWFPLLNNASQDERENWELLGNGEGIHWSDLDEDLSVAGLLAGTH